MKYTDLHKYKRFLCWQITQNGDTFTKIPVNPLTGLPASSNDPNSWVEYSVAREAVDAGRFESVGIALGKELGIVVIDLDKLRPSPEEPFPVWARQIVEELESYTEVSASGRGLHILVAGSIPANVNKQKLHVEAHDSNRMFAISERIFEGRDVIETRDLGAFYQRILTGHIGPDYRPQLTVERHDTQKFRDILNDEWAKHGFDSRSAAIQSALCTLAAKHSLDRDAMREEFESSELRKAWDTKWDRLADRELSQAIEFMSQKQLPASVQVLEFAKPAVPGGDYDFVVNPADGSSDGWFPRGEVSLIGGSSGTGKSTLVIDILMKQSRREPVFNHTTNGLPYLVLLEDRSERAMRRTLTRMRIDAHELPYRPLQLDGLTIAQAVASALDTTDPTPAAVLLEGIDLASQDSNKMSDVARMLKDLQRTAAHYHVAIIGSTGAPKQKPKDRYTSHRDSIIGSQAWSRKVETVATLQKENGSEEDDITVLSVMLRNGPFESFRLKFEDGRLVEAPPAVEGGDEDGKPTFVEVEAWVKTQVEPFDLLALRQRFQLLTATAAKAMIDQLLVYKVVHVVTQGRNKTYVAETPEVFA